MSVDTAVSAAHLTPIDLLGTRLDGNFTAEEAMKHGQLAGWNVRKWPATTTDPDTGKSYPIPGMSTVVRDDPKTKKVGVLSRHNVSDGFNIIQNEQHADFLNALVDESGAHFELAGSLDGGRRVFLSMKLPGHINVGGSDPIENSLLAVNAHDGSMSFTLGILPVRYACSNVLNVKWSGLDNFIRIRHTSGAHDNMVARAREALDISFAYLEGFQQEAEKLIQTTMTQAQFEAIIEREFGAGEDASTAAVTRSENKLEQMAELFADAQTQDGIRDTAWAGFNALTEWFDHFSPTRGNDREVSRAQKALFDPSFKDQALRLMLAQV
jgi:phage/plasmid-like protein (TIGR03299 family)